MGHDQEVKRATRLLGALGIFLISAFLAFDELRHAAWGRTVEGHVVNAEPVMIRQGRGRETPMLSVQYTFPDEGAGQRSERDLVPLGWPLPGENKVSIQHLPGRPDSSRLAGHRSAWALDFFFGSLAVMAAFIFLLDLEAKRSERRPVRKALGK